MNLPLDRNWSKLRDDRVESRKVSQKQIIHVSAWGRTFTQFRMPLLRRLAEVFGRQVICCPYEAKHVEKLRAEGFEVITQSVSAGFSLRIFTEILSLSLLLRKERFDVLVAHQPMGALVGLPAACLARVPVRIYSTGGLKYTPDDNRWRNNLYKYGELSMVKMTAATLAVNIEDFNYLRKIRTVARKAFYVGPRGGCGVDTTEFSPETRRAFRESARNELRIPNKTTVIGYAGRIVWEKGFREIIGAAKILAALNLDHVFLVLGDGPDLDQIQARISSLSAEGLFIFAGYKFSTSSYMAAFDQFVLPSYREGLPIALLEAMAMGIPCIGTNIRGTRQLISDKRTGLLIPPRNARALGDAICLFWKSKALADKVGKEASQHVASTYSQPLMVTRTAQLFLDLAMGTGSV